MKIKILTFISILFITFNMSYILAESASNAGFIPANIWYSKDPFMDGDKIQIYTLIFNPDTRELSGKIQFYDNTTLLGQKSFNVPAKSTKDIYINWNVTAGSHKIFAKIEEAKFLNSNGTYEEASISQNTSETSERVVSKKIEGADTNLNSILETSKNIETKIIDVSKTISDKTPSVISKPIGDSVKFIEDFRQSSNKFSKEETKKIDSEIKIINNKKDKNLTEQYLLNPLKYLEIFFLSVLSFISNSQFSFYLIGFLLIFFVIKFIWKKIL